MHELRLRDMLRSLDEAGIEFLIFGAVALAFYGHVRATADLDIIVHSTPENHDRLIEWLAEHDARLALNPDRFFGPGEAASVRRGANATVLLDLGQLDIVQRLPGLASWGHLTAAAEEYEVDGLRLRTIDRKTFLERKRARGTPQDHADVAAIEGLAD